MLLSPAHQLDRVEACGGSAVGCRLAVDAARVREEVAVHTHGGLDGAGVIDLGHDVGLPIETVGWAHGVKAIAIHIAGGPAAVGPQRAAVVADLAGVTVLGVRVAGLVDHALLVQVAPGGVQVAALAALLATRAREYVLRRQLNGLLALALDGEAIAGHRGGGQHPGGAAPALVGHLGDVAGPLVHRVEGGGQAVGGIGQPGHGLHAVRGLLGAQTQAQSLGVLASPPLVVLAGRPAQVVDGVHAVDELIVGQAELSVALHPAAVQAAALVAVVPRAVELGEVGAAVQAGDDGIGLAEAEGAVVGATVAGIVAIAELIAVAESGCKRGKAEPLEGGIQRV